MGREGVKAKGYFCCFCDVILSFESIQGGRGCLKITIFQCTYFMDGPLCILNEKRMIGCETFSFKFIFKTDIIKVYKHKQLIEGAIPRCYTKTFILKTLQNSKKTPLSGSLFRTPFLQNTSRPLLLNCINTGCYYFKKNVWTCSLYINILYFVMVSNIHFYTVEPNRQAK